MWINSESIEKQAGTTHTVKGRTRAGQRRGGAAEGKAEREDMRIRINRVGLLIKYEGENGVNVTMKHVGEQWYHSSK